ncbi:MAG: hypothetical protein QW701_03850 [Candidatus Nezhaarchaeales archaeon]
MSQKHNAVAEKLSEYCRSNKAITSFLQEMVLRGISEIRPIISSNVEYPELSEFFGKEASKMLEVMIRDGILKGVVVDRILMCPECNAITVRTRYLCPSCKSFNVERVSLIEHIICGFIGSNRLFKKGESEVCPRCGRTLKRAQVDWRIIGMTFECYDCGLMFDEPKIAHKCLPNGHEFDPTNSKYEAVYKYVIKDEVVKMVQEGFLVTSTIHQVLASSGYEVHVDGAVRGLSGVDHRFNVVGSKDGKLTVIETSNLQSGREQLMQMVAKVIDTKPSRALLVVLSQSEEGLRELESLASSLNIRLIAVKNLMEIGEAIRRILSEESEKS